MAQHLFYSSCPIARRSTETFVERPFVVGEPQRFEFNREILWLQESEAVLRFMHGDVELKHGSTYTDFYGYLSSAEGLIDDAKRTTEAYSVTAESSLVIKLVSRVYHRPVIEPDEARLHNQTKPANHKSKWADVPDDWRKEVLVDGDTLRPRLELSSSAKRLSGRPSCRPTRTRH